MQIFIYPNSKALFIYILLSIPVITIGQSKLSYLNSNEAIANSNHINFKNVKLVSNAGEIDTNDCKVFIGLSYGNRPYFGAHAYLDKGAISGFPSYHYRISGYGNYGLHYPQFELMLIKRSIHQGITYKFAAKNSDTDGDEYLNYNEYKHHSLAYGIDYLFNNKTMELDKPLLQPFLGLNTFFTVFNYIDSSIVFDPMNFYSHNLRRKEINFNTSLQLSSGVKLSYKKFLMELSLDFNLIGYYRGRITRVGRVSEYDWELHEYFYKPINEEYVGSDVVFINEYWTEKVFVDAITFKIAYNIFNSKK